MSDPTQSALNAAKGITEILFVGGAADGQRTRMPVFMQWARATGQLRWQGADVHAAVPVDAYRLERLRGATLDYYVYREASLTTDDLMARLLAGYVGGEDAELLKELKAP